ncbi:hypothetical protein MKW92_031442 [Papaver armeniacum]|nr:hypothetical protein MKW92_031442 [Papaver armeniacum]
MDILPHFCPHLDGVMQMKVQERRHLFVSNSKESSLYVCVQEMKMETGTGSCIEEHVRMDVKVANNGLSTYLGKDFEASLSYNIGLVIHLQSNVF